MLVLHEPTTAVDTVTEARIAAGVRELRAGRTTLVIASSPALLAVCDRVLVLRGGEIVAAGTHADAGPRGRDVPRGGAAMSARRGGEPAGGDGPGGDAARGGEPRGEAPRAAPRRHAARGRPHARRARRPHRARLGAALALLGAAVAALLVPPLLGAIVDAVLDRDGVEPYVPASPRAAVVQALLTGVGRQLTAKLGETVLAELREQVVERALAIPAARLERAGSGDLLSAGSPTTSRPSPRRSGPGCRSSLQAGLFVGLTLFGLAALNPWLALAALPAVPIQLLGLRHYLKHVVPLYSHQRVQEGERTQRLIGAITGAKTSRALGLGRARRDEVETTSLAAVETALRAARLQSDRFGRAMNGGELVGLASVLITGFLLVRAGNATVGEATAAALYFHRAFDPVGHAVRARRRLPGGGVRAHAPGRRDDARAGRRSTTPATRGRSGSPRSTTPTSTSTRCCTGSTCASSPASGWR